MRLPHDVKITRDSAQAHSDVCSRVVGQVALFNLASTVAIVVSKKVGLSKRQPDKHIFKQKMKRSQYPLAK